MRPDQQHVSCEMRTLDQSAVIVLLLKLSTADFWLDANVQTSCALSILGCDTSCHHIFSASYSTIKVANENKQHAINANSCATCNTLIQ